MKIDSLYVLLISFTQKLSASNEALLLAMNKIASLTAQMDDKLALFLARQDHVLKEMEKFFHIQVELTEKQIKSIEELTPTAHDKLF